MHILVVGSEVSFQEVKKKFGPDHVYQLAPNHPEAQPLLPHNGVVFDFLLMDDPAMQLIYTGFSGEVFVHSVNTCLAQSINCPPAVIFGFNGWPGCVERPLLEVALVRPGDRDKLASVCDRLSTGFRVVDDRVGLVTPRMISMVVNEAYYTVQDGTAKRADIDLAMQLGTNYPQGPFAWCERVGITNIYHLLDALFQDTRDERYRIAPLLKKEYLRSLTATRYES